MGDQAFSFLSWNVDINPVSAVPNKIIFKLTLFCIASTRLRQASIELLEEITLRRLSISVSRSLTVCL